MLLVLTGEVMKIINNLTRVYGISFPKQKELKEYLDYLEEAKKRDHRKLRKTIGAYLLFQKK